MSRQHMNLPRKIVNVNAGTKLGPVELWRHSIGHGGINSFPLPERVIEGAKKLNPKLVRTFIQEYFNIYPEHGQFNWSKLDPYMDALAATGGKVVAAIIIKPNVLFPKHDQNAWMPNNVEEWQKLIYELVKRYSVEKKIVTHWEIGNEMDSPDGGGAPYHIKEPKDYIEYYKMAIKPILEVFPTAKVGGSACTERDKDTIPALVNYCGKTGLQLDFVSWHTYGNDSEYHNSLVKYYSEAAAGFPGRRLEIMVTEFNKDIFGENGEYVCEEMAYNPQRAAAVATIILGYLDAGLDWSFYYHVWDQTVFFKELDTYYAHSEMMRKCWNEVPHRLGMFGVCGEVRPQYFVYQMLSKMNGERLEANCDDSDLKVLASKNNETYFAFLVNHNNQESRDLFVSVSFSNIKPGVKSLKVYRIDENHKWDSEALELIPVEYRIIDTLEKHLCQVYCPSESVLLVVLEDCE